MVALEEGRHGRSDYWLDYGFGGVACVKINQKPPPPLLLYKMRIYSVLV